MHLLVPVVLWHRLGRDLVAVVHPEVVQLGVEALTLYAFSEENWRRSAVEIKLLMKLLQRFLVQERPTMMNNNVRLLHAGRTDILLGRASGSEDGKVPGIRAHLGEIQTMGGNFPSAMPGVNAVVYFRV